MSINIICEGTSIINMPKNLKKIENDNKIRFEAILQTVGDINRNRRIYDKKTLNDSLKELLPRIKNRELQGELDHPIDNDPARQVTVAYQHVSHSILECDWDGNQLKAVLETTSTTNGFNLFGLIYKDKIPVGFSYRGMGEIEDTYRNGQHCYKVKGPLKTITWDCVSYPSHKEAKLIKITEQVHKQILESINPENIIEQTNERICTKDANGKTYCYIPNTFDMLIENYKSNILNKFKI